VNRRLDVAVLVDEFHALLHTPDATLQTTQNKRQYLEHVILGFSTLVLKVRQNCLDGFQDCNDQGTKCSSTGMIK
jgi:hypothetical protein